MTPYLRVAVIIVAVAVGFALVRGCSREKPVVRVTSETQQGPRHGDRTHSPKPDEKAKPPQGTGPRFEPKIVVIDRDATVRWGDVSGNRRMMATAKEIGWDQSNSTGYALNLRATLFENGKKTSEITAPKAVFHQKDQVLLATGGVTMRSLQRNTTVKSQWVKWFAKHKRVVGNGGVEITSKTADGTSTATAAAFVGDTTLENYTLKSSAKGLEP